MGAPDYPLVPRRLPDGTTVWEERGKAKAVIDAIRAYDPRLSLARDHVHGRWEVWRANEDATQSRVWYRDADLLPEPLEVVAALCDHDTWKGYSPYAAIVAADERRERERDAAFEELIASHADRIHYELVDELGAPASRPMPLGAGRRGHRPYVSPNHPR